MKRINYPLIIAFNLVFTANFCVYGMKRSHSSIESDSKMLTNDALIVLPDDITEKIFIYVSYNQPNGIVVAWLSTMRSVCKDWNNRLLSTGNIKRILSIDTLDIIDELDAIKVNGNHKSYYHAQFLARMIKDGQFLGVKVNGNHENYCRKQVLAQMIKDGQLEVCNHLVDMIIQNNDWEKLKICLESGLVNPIFYDLLQKLWLRDRIFIFKNKIIKLFLDFLLPRLIKGWHGKK